MSPSNDCKYGKQKTLSLSLSFLSLALSPFLSPFSHSSLSPPLSLSLSLSLFFDFYQQYQEDQSIADFVTSLLPLLNTVEKVDLLRDLRYGGMRIFPLLPPISFDLHSSIV